MKVKIKLIGPLRKYNKEDKINENGEISIQSNSTINDLINKLNINTKRKLMFLIDGKQKDSDYKLSDGEKVVILTIVAGG
ncbi:MAG: MoaD/ThiS family protein [Halanaerobiales bacterium]